MTKSLLPIAAASFLFAAPLFTHPETVQAQVPFQDTINFMAATRGINYDFASTGLKWCVSQSWHGTYPTEPDGLGDALDEVAQRSAFNPAQVFSGYCASGDTEPVDLTTYGSTSGNCPPTSPCPSLYVIGRNVTYSDGCQTIEADLYDYINGDLAASASPWKGKQRMIHARATISPWTSIIHVSDAVGGYPELVTVGTIIQDRTCGPGGTGWTGNHVHHDFMPPTQSAYCQWSKNSSNFGDLTTDWQKQNNVNHWVHSLVHTPGTPCITLGAYVADFLLGPNGALDGTGQGTRDLASGARSTVTSVPTGIPGTD